MQSPLLSHGAFGQMTLNDQLKSKILRDFDKKLQTELSTDLYSFIATVKLAEGYSFQDVVDVIFNRDGAKGLREFLEGLVVMLEEFQEENSQGKNQSSSRHLTLLRYPNQIKV